MPKVRLNRGLNPSERQAVAPFKEATCICDHEIEVGEKKIRISDFAMRQLVQERPGEELCIVMGVGR